MKTLEQLRSSSLKYHLEVAHLHAESRGMETLHKERTMFSEKTHRRLVFLAQVLGILAGMGASVLVVYNILLRSGSW